MGKVAFVFPGQGAQKVGMGRDVMEAYPVARSIFEQADAALGEPLSKLCFEGPESELQLTANTQPAILTTSIALFRALESSCDAVAGHSLGEYTANVVAGTLPFEHAVKLVRIRGRYMQQAVPVGEGAMAAVLGADRAVVDEVCSQVDGTVQPVNYNCPGQIVIAGQATAVGVASERLNQRGAKVKALPVSAPFHSVLMRPAEDRLKPHLEDAPFAAPRMPIYVNVDALPVSTAESTKSALIRQVSRPVRWEETIQKMIADGISLFVEIGPGRALTGMIQRIAKDTMRVNVQGVGDLEPARAAIAKMR